LHQLSEGHLHGYGRLTRISSPRFTASGKLPSGVSRQKLLSGPLNFPHILHHASRKGWGRIPKPPLGPLDLQGISLA
jgi:hypothetical protein